MLEQLHKSLVDLLALLQNLNTVLLEKIGRAVEAPEVANAVSSRVEALLRSIPAEKLKEVIACSRNDPVLRTGKTTVCQGASRSHLS